MDNQVTTLKTAVSALRQDNVAPVENTLNEERGKIEGECRELSSRIADKTRTLTELDRLQVELDAVRARLVGERQELIEAHSIKAQAGTALADRAMRMHNA